MESKYIIFFFAFFIYVAIDITQAQYEDVRCKCICPSPEVVRGNKTNRKLYIANVMPSLCKCEYVVIPQADDYVREKEKEFCPRCECKYERRNTTTIFVVVIIIIWVISLLTVYMLFLMCLDPLLNKRRTAYHEHTNEEVTLMLDQYETASQTSNECYVPVMVDDEGKYIFHSKTGIQLHSSSDGG